MPRWRSCRSDGQQPRPRRNRPPASAFLSARAATKLPADTDTPSSLELVCKRTLSADPTPIPQLFLSKSTHSNEFHLHSIQFQRTPPVLLTIFAFLFGVLPESAVEPHTLPRCFSL